MFHDTQPAELDHSGGPDPWAPFRVTHPSEAQTLLRTLRDAAAPLVLAAPDGTAMSCTLWSIDAAQGRLSFSADLDSPQLQGLIDADEAVAVAYLENVKLQFDIDGLLLVRGARTVALQTHMPREIYRFQRRSSYRVRPATRSAPTVMLRHPAIPEMALQIRLLDVSVGGCALLWPHDVPEIRPGVEVKGMHVRIDIDTHFEASMRVHHIASMQAGDQGHRVGCEWEHLDGNAQRALQRYVDQTQKRRRLLSLE